MHLLWNLKISTNESAAWFSKHNIKMLQRRRPWRHNEARTVIMTVEMIQTK